MSAPDVTGGMLDRFRDSGASKHLTILLGAGASSSSGLPGWDELARRLLVSSDVVNSDEAADLVVRLQDPLLAAEAAHHTVGGEAKWKRIVQAALYAGVTELTPSTLAAAAAGHLLTGQDDDTTLITLNFDRLLETAVSDDLESRHIAKTVKSRTDGESEPGVFAVHHLHGVVEPNRSQDVVITLSDFNELLADPDSWQADLLQKSVERGALLIAGTSYRDPDLRSWLHAALRNHNGGNAALVLLAREGFALTRGQFVQVQDALEAEWKAAGLTPILLQDHTDSAQILRELRVLNKNEYLAPQQRAERVWRLHCDEFDVLQDEYCDFLRFDAARLADAFNTDSLNLSLWLADAAGHVVRWASQDRHYRAVTDLRSVDSGHDSRWVAGQALAMERPLFQTLDSQERQDWLRNRVAPVFLDDFGDFSAATVHRWKSVFAVPIRVAVGGLPAFATAVLSIGLPQDADAYRATRIRWFSTALDVANMWAVRLSTTAKRAG